MHGNDLVLRDPDNFDRGFAALDLLGPLSKVGGALFRGGRRLLGSSNVDEYITLYHGTSEAGAAGIRNNGIDPSFFKPKRDFGEGFYTTTDLGQAQRWAARQRGEVLEFRLLKSDFNQLNGLDFATKTPSSLGRFLRHNRLGGRMHSFDTVSGPLLLNPGPFKRGALPDLGGQQTTFHGQTALKKVNKKGSVPLLRKGLLFSFLWLT